MVVRCAMVDGVIGYPMRECSLLSISNEYKLVVVVNDGTMEVSRKAGVFRERQWIGVEYQ